MAISQLKSNRKASGGRYKRVFSKKMANLGSLPAMTRLGPDKATSKRVRAGKIKTLLLNAEKVNVADPKTKKVSVDYIKTVSENNANRNYVRRNIITKGAIVALKSGKNAKITSRPGQTKVLSAVLVE
jgi:small subunit ribosomal protein S8e